MTNRKLEQTLTELFGADVAVCLHRGPPGDAFLFPEEAALVATAIEKRRLEFAVGRDCARKALAKLGMAGCPILAAPDRSPIWPSGFVGSISHTDEVCGAVAAKSSERMGIGFDIETAEPLSDGIGTLVCSDGDRVHFATLPKCHVAGWEKIAFCAKEAFYKCQYPLTQRMVDFRDVTVRLSGGSVGGTFRVESERDVGTVPEISGFWLVDEANVYAGCIC
jgi:4'-phosphopantetheinyl transferase EntD